MSRPMLHMPVDAVVLQAFTVLAQDLGFDSAQAYLRFFMKAQLDKRALHTVYDQPLLPSLTSNSVIALNLMQLQLYSHEANHKTRRLSNGEVFARPQDAIRYLRRLQDGRVMAAYLNKALKLPTTSD